MSLDADLISPRHRFPCAKCGKRRRPTELHPVVVNPPIGGPSWHIEKRCADCIATPTEGDAHE